MKNVCNQWSTRLPFSWMMIACSVVRGATRRLRRTPPTRGCSRPPSRWHALSINQTRSFSEARSSQDALWSSFVLNCSRRSGKQFWAGNPSWLTACSKTRFHTVIAFWTCSISIWTTSFTTTRRSCVRENKIHSICSQRRQEAMSARIQMDLSLRLPRRVKTWASITRSVSLNQAGLTAKKVRIFK